MAKGFFIKLAAGNLARNRRMYLPHFISSTIMVSVYFMVASIIYTRSIGNLNYTDTVRTLFGIGITVMTILIVPFMLYINSFLIKRRKKEFGLYGILGLEKRHVARVIFWENLMLSFSSLILGILTGCVFGRLIFMLLLFALRAMAEGSVYTIPWQAFAFTAGLYSLIFIATTLFNLLHVRLANPIDLLKGGQKGEKKVRFVIPLTLIGLGLLVWAYYTSLTVTNALIAINQFFIAVIAVIVATFLLFTTGSLVLLNLLRKNKGHYYKANNFVAISGMFHRMKQNAAGLASICILSTMVLVTVSTCFALFLGQEDIMQIMYPNDVSVSLVEDATDAQLEELDTLLVQLEKEHRVKIINRHSYSYMRVLTVYKDNTFSAPDYAAMDYQTSYKYLYDINIIPLSSYNDNCNDTETLAENEILVLTNGKTDITETLHIDDRDYRVKRTISGTVFTQGQESIPMLYFVTPDEVSAKQLRDSINPAFQDDPLNDVLVFDIEGSQEDGLSFAKSMRSRGVLLEGVTWVNDIFTNRVESYAIYGGLLFLGIFFTVLFLTATVLIIYFKQVSEGYDDKDRFEILQKVGMDDDEVKHTINKQILIVFFLPLGGALVHLLAASNMIIKMLEAFNLYNRSLSWLCIAATCIIFGAVYAVVFRLTARTYYRIVRMNG